MIIFLVVLPVTVADTNYDKPAPHATNAPSIQRLFARAGSSLALTLPGGKPPARCCSTILNRDEWPPFGTDEATHRDLLVLLPVDATQRVLNLSIQVAGENGLEVIAPAEKLSPAPEALETHTYPNDSGPAAADGHHVVTGWVARVPVTLTPTKQVSSGIYEMGAASLILPLVCFGGAFRRWRQTR